MDIVSILNIPHTMKCCQYFTLIAPQSLPQLPLLPPGRDDSYSMI